MKKRTRISILTCVLTAVLFAGCAGCPGEQPGGPGDDGTMVYRLSDAFPTDASAAAAPGVWGYYGVPQNAVSVSEYTGMTGFGNQTLLSSDGFSESGGGALGKGLAAAVAGHDVAYGFTVPRDGVVELSTESLWRTGSGVAALSVYKNGVRIWPLAEPAYEAALSDQAGLLSVCTAVRAQDRLFFRVSSAGTSGAVLHMDPVVTYLASAVYSESADLELTRPDLSDAEIPDAGASLEADSFAMTGRQPVGTALEVSAEEFGRLLGRGGLTAGAVYRITDSTGLLSVEISRAEYDGLGCVVYAPDGIRLVGGANTTVRNLTVVGPLYLAGSDTLTLVQMEATSLTAEEDVQALRIEDCRIAGGNGTGFENRASGVTVVSSFFAGEIALRDLSVGGNLYENCCFSGDAVAVEVSASDTTVWYSDLRGSLTAEGEAPVNLLVAMNRFTNLGGVRYTGTHNSVVLLNLLDSVEVQDSTNAYVCENVLYGELSFRNVEYLLATRNRMYTDRLTLVDTENYNGDTVTDIDARAEAGVNEALLPHVNKDAFIHMERKYYVRTSDGNRLELTQYIQSKAEDNGRLIIAPGAYRCEERIALTGISDFTVYAYGVLYEKEDFFGDCIMMSECAHVSLRGMTIDMVLNGCGHMIVVRKDESSGAVYYRAAAGMLQDLTDPTYFSDGNGIAYMGYRTDAAYPYADVGLGILRYNPADGMLVSVPSESVFAMLRVGDMMTTRANGGNVINLYGTTAIHFEDFTVLSGSIRCIWDSEAEEGSILNRVAVMPAPAKVIDKETYDAYEALEAQYDVDLGVYVDAWGNYRGTPARTVTADSTHSTYSRSGMQVTSCIFSGLSDDATNHQGSHGRIVSFDSGSGRLVYKQNLATLGYTATCYSFAVGDRVRIYTSSGRVLCDTEALSVTKSIGEVDGYEQYEILIAPDALDPELLSGYDLSSNAAADSKVLIDNLDRNGDGFVYDNVLAENIRSRGFLVKCGGSVIRNCSFRNIGMAAVALVFELEWGESGMAYDTQIENNYFENTGYFKNQTLYSPIAIVGLGMQAKEEYLPYRNITIRGNVICDRATDYALYINSAQNVVVENNDFGIRWDEDGLVPYASVFVNYAADVSFSGNTYSPYLTDIRDCIHVNGNRSITGSDVSGAIPDDPSALSVYTTSLYDNLPGVSVIGNESVLSFGDAWSIGYAPVRNLSGYRPYRILTGSGWYAADEDFWSTSGGMDAFKGYRFAALAHNNAVIRYTAEHSGRAYIRLTRFEAPYSTGDGSADGYFAIFVNDEMVYPTQGGSYENGLAWREITQSTTMDELQQELKDLALDLEAGDQISFVCKRKLEWSAFTVMPSVFYTERKEDA